MPDFETVLLAAGAVAASALIPALAAGLKWPQRGVWPAPPVGSLRSFLFWSLFRTLNVAVLAIALLAITTRGISALQAIALAASAVFGAMYVRTLWELGRKATYCQASGLETSGVYRWTRNPQYAAAIAAFATLAAGVAELRVAALAAALIGVYALMAHAEEPWLRRKYGAAYDAYAARVPRFFNGALLVETLADAIRALRRTQRTTGYSAASFARKPPDWRNHKDE